MTLTAPAARGTTNDDQDLTTRTFMGYRRAHSGRAGVRNLVLIIPSVVCSNTVVQRIAQQVPECVFVTHQHGCSQVGDDVEQTRATLIGYATNPNVAGVLVVSLGWRYQSDGRTRHRKVPRPARTGEPRQARAGAAF